MPAEDGLGLDQHSDPSRLTYSAAQRGHDCPVGHVELRPLHLTAYDSHLVAKKQQLRLRVMYPQTDISYVEDQAQA